MSARWSFLRPAARHRRGRRSLLDHWYRLGDNSGPGGAAQGEAESSSADVENAQVGIGAGVGYGVGRPSAGSFRSTYDMAGPCPSFLHSVSGIVVVDHWNIVAQPTKPLVTAGSPTRCRRKETPRTKCRWLSSGLWLCVCTVPSPSQLLHP